MKTCFISLLNSFFDLRCIDILNVYFTFLTRLALNWKLNDLSCALIAVLVLAVNLEIVVVFIVIVVVVVKVRIIFVVVSVVVVVMFKVVVVV